MLSMTDELEQMDGMIERSQELLEKAEPGSDEFNSISTAIDKLLNRRNDLRKIYNEDEQTTIKIAYDDEHHQHEMAVKQEQLKSEKKKIIGEWVAKGVGYVVIFGGAVVGYKADKDGLMISRSFDRWINKIRFW